MRDNDDRALEGKEAVDTATKMKPEISYAAPKNKGNSFFKVCKLLIGLIFFSLLRFQSSPVIKHAKH